MRTEASEPNPRGHRSRGGIFRLAGDQDLAAVRSEADPGRGVNRQADVSRIGEGRTAAVDAGPDTALEALGPRSLAQDPLERDRRLDGRSRPLEDGEELVRTGVDLAASRPKHGVPHDIPDVPQQGGVALTELPQQGR